VLKILTLATKPKWLLRAKTKAHKQFEYKIAMNFGSRPFLVEKNSRLRYKQRLGICMQLRARRSLGSGDFPEPGHKPDRTRIPSIVEAAMQPARESAVATFGKRCSRCLAFRHAERWHRACGVLTVNCAPIVSPRRKLMAKWERCRENYGARCEKTRGA